MAQKVTTEMIEQINERFVELKNKSAVAREFNLSPSTVAKYIIPGYTKKSDIIPQILSTERIREMEDYICPVEILTLETALQLTEDEEEDLEELWRMLTL